MKALVWEAVRRMQMHDDVPQPVPAADEVLLRVGAAGICGSELEGYLGMHPRRIPPLIMGHEFSGTIEAVGENVPGITPGTRAAVHPFVYCGECELCAAGHDNVCPQRQLIGMNRPGAFAEYVTVPARNLVPLSDRLSDAEGALVEPLATAVHALRRLQGSPVGTAVVFGAGPIGLLCMEVAMLHGGSPVLVSDVNSARLETAHALGATRTVNPNEEDLQAVMRELTNGRMADTTIDAVGRAITRKQALDLLRPTGQALYVGMHDNGHDLDVQEVIIRKELTVHGCYAYTFADFQAAAQLLEAGRIGLTRYCTTLPLEEGGNAFDTLLDRPGNLVKVLLKP